jgi:methylmalonyl-CoA mutase cobalamin-binding domain/chain
MVGIFLQTAGWQVYGLCIDVTAEEFVEKALEVDARVIGASAMIYTTAVNIKKLRDEIDRRGLKGHVQLAVGCVVFKLRPELVAEVGGDGTTASAVNAPALFEELWHAFSESSSSVESISSISPMAMKIVRSQNRNKRSNLGI